MAADPRSIAHHRHGRALLARRRFAEAATELAAAIALSPNVTDVLADLADALLELRQVEQAQTCVARALALTPDHAASLVQLARLHLATQRVGEARSVLDAVLARTPDDPIALTYLGDARTEQGEIDAAAACFERATTIEPGFAKAHVYLGLARRAQGRVREAAACFERAIALHPDYASARANRAHALLLLGDYAEGWKEHEWRWQANKAPGAPTPGGMRLWDGSDFAGKTIVLYGEQGAGDTIQFVRYVASIAARMPQANVVLVCQMALRRLLAGIPGVRRLMTEAEAAAPFGIQGDVHWPLMSLPFVFGTTLSTIPAQMPYLRAEPALQEKWRARLPADGRLKVGLAWAGNPLHQDDRNRSLPLANLAPLLDCPGVRFIGLQTGPRAAEIAACGLAPAITDLSADLVDYAETAAAVSQLDLVISVDTSVAHLAGALARPTWTLLPFAPDWRWLLEREDCPWYPTMRLFRQSPSRQWAPVVARVREALAAAAQNDRA
ncbi:MAG: tetratricopeptide repeat protein [Proteobacteria bacterium]|nr:tetratricopeptide repeat protein [Pseudomonadota bacterium]